MNKSSLKSCASSAESVALQQQDLFSAALAAGYDDGRDEMNLSEFPITAVGNRVDPSIKTLVYEDLTRDSSNGELLKRRLTVTASDAYGLPAAIDDELLLGMVQLSRIQGFVSQEVFFTPYQLLQILGWPDHEAYYKRLKEGLKRWAGVLMSYENAWRDKATGRWVDAAFHFIDNVEFHRRDGRNSFAKEGLSYFKWNDVIFNSFKAGNLKQLDFSLYRRLNSGLAKRLFRFLDKRFYHQSRLTFDLQIFAFEKVGITRANIDAAQIKRRLMGGILELESVGYIVPATQAARFTKNGKKWSVHFERSQRSAGNGGSGALDRKPDQVNGNQVDILSDVFSTPEAVLEAKLVTHGVSRAKAKKFVASHSAPEIELQIEALEFLITQGKKPINTGGWLSQAIIDGYNPPQNFKPQAERIKEKQEKENEAKRRAAKKQERQTEARRREERKRQAFEEQRKKAADYLLTLNREELAALEDEAVKDAGIPVKRSGVLWDSLICSYVTRLLEKRD